MGDKREGRKCQEFERQRKRQREEEGREKVGRLVLEMTQSMTFRPKSSSTV